MKEKEISTSTADQEIGTQDNRAQMKRLLPETAGVLFVITDFQYIVRSTIEVFTQFCKSIQIYPGYLILAVIVKLCSL